MLIWIFLCVGVCGLGRSVDAQTWTQQVSGTGRQLLAVEFLSTTQLVAAGQKNGASFTLLVSTDGAVSWSPAAIATPPGSDNLNALAFEGANGIVAGDGGVVLRSSDSGNNWQPATVNPAPQDLEAIAFLSPSSVAVGRRSAGNLNIVYSGDNGDNWSVATVPAINENLVDVAFISPTILVAIGDGGTIVRSVDAGANWTDVGGITANDLYALDASGGKVVAVGRDGGGFMTVVYSIDSGATWNNAVIAGGTASRVESVRFLNSSTVIAAGRAFGGNFTIIRSVDGGANWAVPTGLVGGGENLNAIANVNSFAAAVGDNGAIVVSEDLGATWSQQVSGSVANLAFADAINPVIVVGAGGEVLLSTNQATAAAAAGGGGGAAAGAGPFGVQINAQAPVKDVPIGAEWLVPVLLLGIRYCRVR